MNEVLQFVSGLAALVLGADLVVRGSARLALGWGLSPMMVGLTLVAFGSSGPELAIGLDAALAGHTDLALGTVVGSNIFNLLGILGLSALLRPLTLDLQILRGQVPVMVGAALMVLLLSLDGRIGHVDGMLLAAALTGCIGWLVLKARRAPAEEARAAYEAEWKRAPTPRTGLNLLVAAGGLGLLVVGAQALVDASVGVGRLLGVSELVIGLTVLALGASLPEFVTSVIATLRGERELAVGNLIGSCTFNALGCLGLSALMAPEGLPLPPAVARFDLWVMAAAALALLPVALAGRRIARWEGVVLLNYYGAYLAYLVLATRHDTVLPDLSAVMLAFVLPLTMVTLVVATLKPPR